MEDKFVIGHTGRFEYQKNQEFLVKVFSKVYKENPKARLVLVGEGKNEQNVKDMVKTLGIRNAVLFLGWREDVAELLQAIDMYCLPSRFEGLGIALVEAQAAGLKCIASDTVPLEAKLTDDLQYLELDEEIWIKEIRKIMCGYERKETIEQIRSAGYDIEQQIKNIEMEYGL